ncbi:kinetochore protein NDC80 homolog [Engraulis encrasicolus]|uniref:kinetochore protein NDC80 homolog n=1 Tax=Engraulis encrasicolus TaxID=184585 RepID=UPI002FCEC838
MSRRTGNRYSEVPLRVAGNRMSITAATPQSKDLLGRLSVAKVQSGTSERRTSFFGSNGNQRNSFLGTYGGTSEKIKDSRPLHDKTFIMQCIKQLCEFLSDNSFPGTITVKALQSPSTKEFLKIFEFVMSLLDSSFQMPTARIEEEIPKIFKDIGYPFALSKSSMYSVGAPHTWPQVLGALVWLMDLVKLFSPMQEQDLLFMDFPDTEASVEDGVEYNKLFVDYTRDTYYKYMQGSDTFDEEDGDYLTSLKRLYNVDEDHLESQMQMYHSLAEEVNRLERESHKDPLMNKRTEKLKLQTDLQKLQEYIEMLRDFKQKQDAKGATLAEEIEATTLQRDTLRQEQARLQTILQNQKFKPADIERINQERNELQQQVDSMSRRLEETEQQLWAEEIALSKAKEETDKELAEYHKLARKLKLIPQSAPNSFGHDFEIKSCREFSRESIGEWKTRIETPLRNMILEVEDEFLTLTNKKLSLQESLEQKRFNLMEKSKDVKQLKDQIKRLDEQLEHDEQEMACEEERWAAEIGQAESHKKLLEKNVMEGYDEAMEQLKAAQQQYHLVLQETKEKKRSVVKNLTGIMSAAVSHLSIIEKQIKDAAERARRVHNKDTQQQTMAELKQLEAAVTEYKEKVKLYCSQAQKYLK